jgi:hypothetical protein
MVPNGTSGWSWTVKSREECGGNEDPLAAAERGPFGEDVHRFVQLFLWLAAFLDANVEEVFI